MRYASIVLFPIFRAWLRERSGGAGRSMLQLSLGHARSCWLQEWFVWRLPPARRLAVPGGAVGRRPQSRLRYLDDVVAEAERDVIRLALRMSKGNKTRAARMLGISRARLYDRITQLQLPSEEHAA